MTPLDAVAAALRERLLAGRPAPLPGLGTLVRQHVPSRIEERPDGTRMLLPPGETIGLGPARADADSLAQPFAAFSGIPADRAEAAYAQAMDQIEAVLSATGEVRLVGVGLLRRTSGGVVLGVEADLLAAVNRRYEGLTPVATPPPTPPPTAIPTPPPPPVAEPVSTPLPEPDPTPEPEPAPPAPQTPPVADAPASASPLDATFDGDAEGDEEIDALLHASGIGRHVDPPAPPPVADEPPVVPASEPPPAEPPTDAAPEAEAPSPEPTEPDAEEAPLAVPFGGPDAPPLPEVLPPTPPESDPGEGWGDETWAAPSVAGGAGSDLGAEPPIEDADFDVVVPGLDEPEDLAPGVDPFTDTFGGHTHIADASEPDAEPAGVVGSLDDVPATPRAPGALATAVPIETVGPPEATAVALPPVTEPDPEPTKRRVWPWVLLLLLVLAAAAAVVFWDQIAALIDRPVPGQTYTASAEGAGTDAATTPSYTVPEGLDAADSLGDAALPASARPDSLARPGEARPGAVAAPAATAPVAASTTGPSRERSSRSARAAQVTDDDESASTQPAMGRAPAADIAMLPPRLAGLASRDANALSGPDEIDPGAGGFSFVVLSTPARAEAEPLATRWRRAGYRVSVLTADIGGRAMYRVAIGQFSSRDQALRLRDRIGPQAPADTWLLDLRTL